MERLRDLSPEEELAHNLQIPLERIHFLVNECGMPVEDEAWGMWMADEEHQAIILAEKEAEFNRKMHAPTNEASPVS